MTDSSGPQLPPPSASGRAVADGPPPIESSIRATRTARPAGAPSTAAEGPRTTRSASRARPLRRRRDPRLGIAAGVVGVVIVAVAVIALSGHGGTAATASAAGSPAASAPGIAGAAPASASSALSPTASGAVVVPGPVAGSAATFQLALVAPNDDFRAGYTSAQVAALVKSGKVRIPCGLTSASIAGAAVTLPAACMKATSIPALLAKTAGALALLPPGLVDPRVKALTIDGADLFGNTVIRKRAYPLTGTSDALPAEMAGAATLYDANDIRTIVSTGDTCPDRDVSLWAVVKSKGWDWTLKGGTARYTGVHMDRQFDGPAGNGWPVVTAVRTGTGIGGVWSMIHDADIAVNDFECPTVAGFTQHNSGTYFTIDPRVMGLMKRVGMDVLSLASNHITDLGTDGILQTVKYADAAGVLHAGAGKNTAAAMKPAIVNVRGLRFAILSWDATGQSRSATPTLAGSLRPTAANVKKAVALARKQADIVIAMPQWNWPEYSAPFAKIALQQRDAWFAAGVDDILGSGTHWAGAISVTRPDPAKGWRVAVTSHGNFLFGQSWSRQTQEGLIYELAFRGKDLVQVRFHPYIVMDSAQPSLTDPQTDGMFIQKQMLASSYLP